VRSLGFDLDELQRDGLLVVLSFQVGPTELVVAGEFDFEPLFAVLGEATGRVGAKRVVNGYPFVISARGFVVLPITSITLDGKTSLGANLADAACRRGERVLWVLFEESPERAARPSAFGLETHLALLAQLLDEVEPSLAVRTGSRASYFTLAAVPGTP
jgi:hypothetical protein